MVIIINKLTNRQIDKLTNRQIDKSANRQIDKSYFGTIIVTVPNVKITNL